MPVTKRFVPVLVVLESLGAECRSGRVLEHCTRSESQPAFALLNAFSRLPFCDQIKILQSSDTLPSRLFEEDDEKCLMSIPDLLQDISTLI
jgi:hypothetical protein